MTYLRKATVLVGVSFTLGLTLVTFVNARQGNEAPKHVVLCQSEQSGQVVSADSKKDHKCPIKSRPINVSTAQSAIIRFDYDTNEPFGPGIYNASRSRGLKALKRVETTNYGAAYCIQLDFDAKYVSPPLVYSVYSSDPNEVSIFNSYCTAPFEYFAWSTAGQSIFFTE